MKNVRLATLRCLGLAVPASLLMFIGGALAADDGINPAQLRRFIDRQVGGIEKLMVPARDEDLPQPRLANGSIDPQFRITEAKRYLGKQLFHDPVRLVRIRPEFGGIPATAHTASCGSCHQGESASKAGTLLNFAAGGEGRHYTDAAGNFIPRRRANVGLLPQRRTEPLGPGAALVDNLPTLTDIYQTPEGIVIGSPALGRKLAAQFPEMDAVRLLGSGRKDALDSVGRNAPGAIGAAFNNRLLLDGFAGEPDASPGGLNPFGHPAQENVALLLLDAHRLLEDQSAVLQQYPAYVKLFQEAFPDEAARFAATGDMNDLINDVTVFRATATFLRTTITRDTPWDRFLAGKNGALTPAQQRGAKLFFTPAGGRDRGAGCYSCHSGPALNKQVNDPDVAGVGEFVEQNFYNLGLGDHPVQALNRAARNDPGFRDMGRKEITGESTDAFKFRVLTLRQLKDARFFFHNGAFSSVKSVVQYFNAGIPQDAQAGATATDRFTHPGGSGSQRGLGLTENEVDDLTDFLENALYDPAFVRFDRKSPKTFFQLSPPDFLYSIYRPDLAALGARDGFPLSGLAQDNDDDLSRRDMGLQFLDVTGRVQIVLIDQKVGGNGKRQEDVYRITNSSNSIVDTHLLIIARGLSKRAKMENASGTTSAGEPYLRVFLTDGVLLPGQSIVQSLVFKRKEKDPPLSYTLNLQSGQGKP